MTADDVEEDVLELAEVEASAVEGDDTGSERHGESLATATCHGA